MGAFQSHDPLYDQTTSDTFDLTLEATVAEGAIPPRYETPSASQFSIFSNEAVTIDGCDWVFVRTGLSFAMPFMLILIVRGIGCDHWEVQEEVVDYDTTGELVLRLRRNGTGESAGAKTCIPAGSRVAVGVVVPIARPSFTLHKPPSAEESDEGESV